MPNVASLTDLVNIVRLNSPIIWYGLMAPIWLVALLGCGWAQYRDHYRRRRFLTTYHAFAAQATGPAASNPLGAPGGVSGAVAPPKTRAMEYTAPRPTPALQAYRGSDWLDVHCDVVVGRPSKEFDGASTLCASDALPWSARASHDRPKILSCRSSLPGIATSLLLLPGDGEAQPAVAAAPPKTILQSFQDFTLRRHFHASHLEYPPTSNLQGFVRLFGWQCVILMTVLCGGIWFGVVQEGSAFVRLLQVRARARARAQRDASG